MDVQATSSSAAVATALLPPAPPASAPASAPAPGATVPVVSGTDTGSAGNSFRSQIGRDAWSCDPAGERRT